ncbi:unnamed protein product [Porites lobata]|uniref:Uncharacterized protein n=1 Tax=Porites lobata TaxID=104759 RepID=A0ABN8N439_9CNID|nr:unnamed protein product [Porites lobata]
MVPTLASEGSAIEVQSVSGDTEVLIQKELLNVMAEDLAAKVISSSLREVAEIDLQEEGVSVVAHEVDEAKKENSAVKFVPDFAIELESVRGATEVLVRDEILNVISDDLAAEAITNSLRELESASLAEDIASEAEKIIPGVTCELTDNVMELESEDPKVHESAKKTLSDVPSEDAKLSNKVHECTLEWETVSAVQPEIAMEFENITAVTEIHSQEEVVSVVAHEFGEAKKENSAVKLVSDFAIELESVRGATEVQVQEELINVTAEDLAAEAITRSLTELESASLVEDIASEAEKTISGVTCELTDSVIEPESEDPEVHERVKETLSDVPSEDDKLSNKAYECTLEWKTVSAIQPEIAVEFENVTAATEMCLQQEVVPVVAHEASEAKKENSAVKIVSDFAIELESVRGATEVQVQEELLNVIAEDLTAEVITSSLRELESLALAEDIAPEAEIIQAVVCELTDSVIELESEDVVLDEVSQTSVDIIVDKLSGTVEGSECMLGWETVGVIESEVAAEFEGVTEVPDILVQEKIIPSVVHESSAAEVKLDLSFEPQSVTAAIDFPLEQRNSTRITRESVLPKSDSAREFFPECSLLMEYGSDVSVISNEVAAAEVKTSCTFWPESSLDLKSIEMCAAECSDPNDDIIGKKTMPNREFELSCMAGKVDQHVLNAKAVEFIPRFSTTSFFGTDKVAKLERGTEGQIDQHHHVLNPDADEFIPGFQATRAFETNVFGKLELGIAGQDDQRHILNPNADTFIPRFQATGNSNRRFWHTRVWQHEHAQ